MNPQGIRYFMGKGVIVLVFLLILGVGLLMFLVPFRGISSSPMKNQPAPSVTVLEHSGEVDIHSGTYVVRGTAKNTGTTPVVKVYIVVTTYDANGAEFGSSYDALINLDPGEEAPFRIEARPYYNGVKVARYNIVPDLNYVPQL
jgi:hypothetical protein